MDAYQSRARAEEKRRKLHQRRERLRELLEKENMEYEVLYSFFYMIVACAYMYMISYIMKYIQLYFIA